MVAVPGPALRYCSPQPFDRGGAGADPSQCCKPATSPMPDMRRPLPLVLPTGSRLLVVAGTTVDAASVDCLLSLSGADHHRDWLCLARDNWLGGVGLAGRLDRFRHVLTITPAGPGHPQLAVVQRLVVALCVAPSGEEGCPWGVDVVIDVSRAATAQTPPQPAIGATSGASLLDVGSLTRWHCRRGTVIASRGDALSLA